MCIFTSRQFSFTTLTHDHQGSSVMDTKRVHAEEDAEFTCEICSWPLGMTMREEGGGWTRQHKDKCLLKKGYTKADRHKLRQN